MTGVASPRSHSSARDAETPAVLSLKSQLLRLRDSPASRFEIISAHEHLQVDLASLFARRLRPRILVLDEIQLILVLRNTPFAEDDHVTLFFQIVTDLLRLVAAKIRELREKAESALGKKFDTRKFHDTVLRHGPMPLTVLEKHIDWFIEQERKE